MKYAACTDMPGPGHSGIQELTHRRNMTGASWQLVAACAVIQVTYICVSKLRNCASDSRIDVPQITEAHVSARLSLG